MTTKQEIEDWFQRGVKEGRAYMLVVCDTFDYSDYPVYADSSEAAKNNKANPGKMQKVMEVYDLHAPMEAQLSADRAMAI